MRLGVNFLRAVLYSYQNVVGIYLIWPKIAIVILEYKLHAGNRKGNAIIAKLISLMEEAVIIEYRVRKYINNKRISKNPIT